MTQFVAVKFKPYDSRSYTYQNDGEEQVGVGDTIEVTTRLGTQKVKVIAVTDKAPAFACKPTGRIVERAAEKASQK